MPTDDSSEPPAVYEIRVQGQLARHWAEWLGAATLAVEAGAGGPVTRICAPVADQAALRGLVTKLWDMNLVLLALRRIEADRSVL